MIAKQLFSSAFIKSVFSQKRSVFSLVRCLLLLTFFLVGAASSNASVRDWERGIAVTSEAPDQLLSPSSDAVITRASQIGANFISLSPTWYQNDDGSIFIQPRAETTASDAA